MRVLDSRRLTGPNLLLDGPGAILEVALQGLDPERAIEAWRSELEPLLAALGWGDATIATRTARDEVQLAFGAPIDALYAATEVNESAWAAAARRLGESGAIWEPGHDPDEVRLEEPHDDGDPADPEDVVARLKEAIDRERNPALLQILAEADRRGVTLLSDDRRVSVGLGTGARAWPLEETSAAIGQLPWTSVHDVPVALVTGTNGKTTTVRLLGAIARAAGRVAGVTSTDRVTVGDEIVAVGDYSGPNGARTVLRDRRVEIAILEVARGGILRRGLALPHARVALVTNVANDHLGEFGIFDLEALADVKLVVTKAIGPDGRIVLNADDARLLARGRAAAAPVIWFTLDRNHPEVRAHLERGGEACLLDGETVVLAHGPQRRVVASVNDVPITFAGAARHNVSNVLAATATAAALGIPIEAIGRGLLAFTGDIDSNPGRGNVWRLGGATAIVDFAHNPHGLAALIEMARSMPARRRAVVIGQAGDRDDEAIRELTRAAWALQPQRIFVKEMETLLRGRAPGGVTAVIAGELARLGAPRDAVVHCGSEIEAVRASLLWARDGDQVVLTVHAERAAVTALIERLATGGWKPGDSLLEPQP